MLHLQKFILTNLGIINNYTVAKKDYENTWNEFQNIAEIQNLDAGRWC